MNGQRGWLLGLLVAQLLLIGALLLARGPAGTAPEKLLGVAPASVRSLSLEVAVEDDADDGIQRVELQRTDDGWQVDGQPADQDKIEALLKQLTELGPGWPVARTAAARERFAVTDDGFRKRLVLETDDAKMVLLLGTSPGFKRLHGRRGGDSAIYSVALADYDLPTAIDDWLDKGLLALPAGALVSAQRVGQWTLSRSSGPDADPGARWLLRSLAPSGAAREADPVKVERWLDGFRTLRVLSMLGTAEGEAETSEAVAQFELELTGRSFRYAVYHDKEVDRYSIARADVDGRFELANYSAEQLQSSLAALLPEPSTADGEAEQQPATAAAGGGG